MLKKLLEEKLIDYVAMDIKTSLNNYHIVTNTTNPKLENIKEYINILKSNNIYYEFRTTLVKEYHDLNVIKEMKILLKDTKKLFLQKFVLRDTCLNQNLNEVEKEVAEKFKKELEETINKVYLRGY